MKNLLLGLSLVLLDVSLFFSGHQIELLPDFVGFWFIAMNMQRLSKESRVFAKFAAPAKGAAAVSAVLYILTAMNIEIGWLAALVDAAAILLGLGITWVVLQGVHEFEINRSVSLQFDVLMYGLRNLAIAAAASFVLNLFPIVGFFGWVIEMIFAFGFLVDFKKTAILFSRPKELFRLEQYNEE